MMSRVGEVFQTWRFHFRATEERAFQFPRFRHRVPEGIRFPVISQHGTVNQQGEFRRSPHRSWKSKFPCEAGFTLLEILISMTILALIFVAVLGAIHVGSKSWESGELRAEENQRTRTLYDTLARDLTMLYPLRVKSQDDKEIVIFRGKPDSLSFATLPQSYGAEPFSHMIRIVTYSVEPDRGLVSAESYPLVSAEDAPILQEGRTKGLDERVLEARFRYLVPEGKPEEKLPPTWHDFWDPSQDETPPSASVSLVPLGGRRALQGSERLPLAVEITLTIQQANQRGARDLILPPLVFSVRVGQAVGQTS
jgi:prepilin-type N-terminal cleavage/methylation domain-containing protein